MTGILRCKPSKVFWFLIPRRFNNSNACKGLGLTNLQRLCTHCMAPNHSEFPEPWACVSTPGDVLLCYNNRPWIQNSLLLNKEVGPVHTWCGQTGTRNSSTAGFCLPCFDHDPALAPHAMSLCLGNRGKHVDMPCLHPAGGVLLFLPDHNLTSQIKFGIHSSDLLLSPCEAQEQRKELSFTRAILWKPSATTVRPNGSRFSEN